ncbi:ABC transporter permease [Nesterenkonia sp. MY13]|uniref:ABC transporter permease n=1 Tax=Nesterenkonia sedimenti TaxID=1463632 RepID=A0A7X8YE32_9MICC|nr:ABC transporter permease [Nesterenkonia sedimenti]NLS09787.1 ABC transporter permease [Nesterenkonia sedimenti]
MSEQSTAPETTAVQAEPLEQAETQLQPIKWKFPITYLVLALMGLGFALLTPAGAETEFRSSTGNEFISIPAVIVPSQASTLMLSIALLLLAGLSLFCAGRRIRLGIWHPLLFGLLFVLTFLIYAGAGRGAVIPMITLLSGTLMLSVPLIFGAMCGLVGERSGIINIAIEGQLLAGAFLAAVAASFFTSAYVGLLAAPFAGAAVGGLLVWFAVKYHVNQIIVGVVLNVLVIGLTSFLYSTVLSENPEVWNARQQLPRIEIPVLSQIPIIGPVMFNQTILVYLMYVIVIALQILLFRSRWGLRIRAVGEHPKAADTVGINVPRTRVINTILAGSIAGLGGAYFTVGQGLAFGQEMSAGQGFIALAAMILGRWNPKGALFAALLFGFSTSVGQTLSTIGTPVPSEILLMLPYVITIFAVAGFVGRVRPPAAEGVPYVK